MNNTCFKCDTIIVDPNPIRCTTCNAHFHPFCVTNTESTLEDCSRCASVLVVGNSVSIHTIMSSVGSKRDDKTQGSIQLPPVTENPLASTSSVILITNTSTSQPEDKQNGNANDIEQTKPPASVRGSQSYRSTKSTKMQMLLQMAEEKRKMELEFIAQEEKILAARRRANETYLAEKEKIIEQLDEMQNSNGGSSIRSDNMRTKVSEWLQTSSTPIVPPTVTFSSNPTTLPTNVTNVYSKPVTSPAVNQNSTFIGNGKPLTSTNNMNFVEPARLTKEVLAARQTDSKSNLSFDGRPKNWPTFYSHFKLSSTQCQYTDVDNIIRLRNALKGKAYKAVHGALSHPSNVSYIMRTLEQLFGKPEFIINELIKEVKEFSLLKLDKFGDIVEYSLLVNNMCMTMQGAEMSNHLWNPVLLQDLVSKLPVQLQREWAQHSLPNPHVNLESFSFWIQDKANECALLLTEPPSFGENKQKKASVLLHENQLSSYASNSECLCCKGECKDVTVCDKFQQLTYKEKYDVVNTNLLCKKCLKRHRNPCLRKELCGVNGCGYKHHPQLHKPTEGEQQVNTHNDDAGYSIFKIVPVTLFNKEKAFSTYALLDDGSSVTLIDRAVAESMHLEGTPQPLCLKWTTETQRMEPDSVSLSIQISGTNGKQFVLKQARTVSTLDLPRQTLSSSQLKTNHKHLRGISFESYQDAKPTVLIGLNNVHLMMPHKTRAGTDDEPVAIKTQLGWVIFGSNDGTSSNKEVFHVCECKQNLNQLEEILREYIAVDNLNIARPITDLLSKEDERALSILKQTTKFTENRYEVGLLWRYDNFTMPSSFGMAMCRLKCFEKQMQKDENLRKQMQNQIDEYMTSGYIREIQDSDKVDSCKSWYLPIFAVKNPNKPKKVRMVWDAAAAVNNTSLNSFLLKGPDNLVNLPGVLFRFRQFEFAIVGDIKQMFHQIKMKKEDQNSLRFLWTNADGCLKTFIMQVMCFGPSCSPSSAQYIKNLNADKFSELYPRAVESIKENHYVDDMLDSVCSIDEAKELIDQVKLIHQSGGFVIRNFLSNSTEVLKHCTKNVPVNEFVLPENNTEKVLGMWWNFRKDTFKYSLKFNKGNIDILEGKCIPTKRQVLQVLMSIYDPLGLIAHYLIYPKILLQQIWKCGIDWDEKIPEELHQLWGKWTHNLQSLKKIKIPRWYGISKSTSSIQLHIFVDASLEAYAAAAYIRFSSKDGMRCRLMSAKSKVAPLKILSVPRLELNAALIGARLSAQIKKSHSISFDETYFWTDSKSVWCWIRSETRKYKPYVEYRVAEILDLSSSHQWRWLPTELNVADKATRQILQQVKNKSEWFKGPKFLRSTEETWPSQPGKSITTNEELRPQYMLHISSSPIEFMRFSKWNRLRRTMAYVKRFIHNMLSFKNKYQRSYGSLTPSEYDLAEQCAIEVVLERRKGIFSSEEYKEAEEELYRIAQQDGFADEISALSKNLALDNSSSIKSYLPFLDLHNVLRSNSRLHFMEGVSYDFKNPILLPNSHRITHLIISYHHEKFWHQQHEAVINELNQRYLIPSLKSTFRKIRANCQECKNKKSKPVVPLMGNLHQARLQVFTRAFTYIGIDFFGPMNVAVGRQRQKRWGVLITCLTTRAIHMEVSHSLNTDSCIMSIKRFIARRGEPKEIYSDQGTNFKSASKELKKELEKLDHSGLAEEFVSTVTEWFFNPPGAPHMGGAWERLIRCVKNALFAALPTRTPNEELLLTLLCQVEFVVNSRPLTTVPLESEDSDVLTPNHFLIGSSNGAKTFGEIPSGADCMLENWKKSNRFMSHYYTKFMKTYLPSIRRRTKDFDPMAREIEVGDVVVIVDESFSRSMWKKGKVLEVYKSRDGFVRKATVQTENGVFQRAAAKLAVLDVRSKDGNPEELPGGSVTSPAYPTQKNDARDEE